MLPSGPGGLVLHPRTRVEVCAAQAWRGVGQQLS